MGFEDVRERERRVGSVGYRWEFEIVQVVELIPPKLKSQMQKVSMMYSNVTVTSVLCRKRCFRDRSVY